MKDKLIQCICVILAIISIAIVIYSYLFTDETPQYQEIVGGSAIYYRDTIETGAQVGGSGICSSALDKYN